MDFLENGFSMQVNQMSALALAFVGDSVFDLFIRGRLATRKKESAHQLHMKATRYVKAAAQSKIATALQDNLDEEEKAVFRRGRNAKSSTMPKNANIMDYHRATGFEAVLGYLYLLGRNERLVELLKMAAEVIELEGEGSNGSKKG
ncbi:MAG: Mini-ribonuclease 3 [Clostridiaceae bacterium]|jgi:ribonuclease-3 family protein|nr:Mini-ribonuclease 3 [Clostridiaceae bacterium]